MDWWNSRSDIIRTFLMIVAVVIAVLASVFAYFKVEEIIEEERTLQVHITANPNSGNAPLTVVFASTIDGGTPEYRYSWVFGDGDTSSLPNPTHTYLGDGSFTAFLLVTDGAGRAGSDSAAIAVSVSPLVVSLTASSTSGDAPLNVTFDATASGGIPPYSYVWQFGDGTSGQGPHVTHTYEDPGTYAATVTITDSDSQKEDAFIGISVKKSAEVPGFELAMVLTILVALGLVWNRRKRRP